MIEGVQMWLVIGSKMNALQKSISLQSPVEQRQLRVTETLFYSAICTVWGKYIR